MESSNPDLEQRWARCRLDALMKTSGGMVLGALGSLLFFRAKAWPVVFGGGLGLGLAYINCEQDINKVLKKN